MNVIVIGGGPAGMISAIKSAEYGNKVTLVEKMSELGKKLKITGKGRCNVTSSLPIEDFIKNIPGNGKFLYSAFDKYSNKDIIQFLEERGLKLKEERGNRVFPVTDNAQDVIECFKKELKKRDVKIIYNTQVKEILTEEVEEEGRKYKKVIGIKTEKSKILCDKVILATGGKSYPVTGSTGDGYELAKKLGHSTTQINPSLVPLEAYDNEKCRNMQGLSLKNISIKLIDISKNKTIYEDFGEMLFTHYGISGPVILSASAHLVRYKNKEEKLKKHEIILKIDLKPAISQEKLENRIERDFSKELKKQYKNSLNDLLPKKMIPIIIRESKINPEKRVCDISKEEKKEISFLLKNFCIEIKGFRPIDEAIITSGGIVTKEINPKTMESKIIKGLFFAGEIIDVDAYTGGFNLQIAYSTGYVAGSEEN